MRQADVVVVGLGAIGAATVLHATRLGLRVVGIDRFHPPHVLGSTHGESRITRTAIGEGEQYVPLALRSHELWSQLETDTGRRLFNRCGGLWIHGAKASRLHDQDDFFGNTLRAAQRFGIAHEMLDARGIHDQFPRFTLTGNERGYHEPGAGWLNPEACVETQLELARRGGAALHFNEPATALQVDNKAITVTTAQNVFQPGVLVVCAGAWMPQMLPDWSMGELLVRRQSLHWFEADDTVSVGKEPVFIWHWGENQDETFYGFPAADGAMKMATEQRTTTTMADDRVHNVGANESAAFFARHVAGRIKGVASTVARSASCLYTNAPRARFVIDPIAGHDRAIGVSACSGHGFKHSAAMGEALAQWVVTGQRPAVLTPFSRAARQAGLARSEPAL
jgi:sarcosine oxidase